MKNYNKYDRPDYDKNYGRVLGMDNSGMSYEEIAMATGLAEWQVIDIVQRGWARA